MKRKLAIFAAGLVCFMGLLGFAGCKQSYYGTWKFYQGYEDGLYFKIGDEFTRGEILSEDFMTLIINENGMAALTMESKREHDMKGFYWEKTDDGLLIGSGATIKIKGGILRFSGYKHGESEDMEWLEFTYQSGDQTLPLELQEQAKAGR